MKTIAIIIGMLLLIAFIGGWWYYSAVRKYDTVRSILLAKGIVLLLFLGVAAFGYLVFSA